MQATDDTIRIGTGVINNTGTIRSTGELDFGGFWTPPGLASDGIAIVNQFDSSFVPGANGVLVVNNSATGIIEGPRAGINFSGGGTINNAGVIHGETTGFFTGGGNDFANTLVLNNSGSITGGSEDNGLNSGGFRGGVTVFGGLESAVVTNSGTISSDYHGFYSEEGIDITNTVTGLMKGDADGTGDDAVSFYGSRLIDFQVEVTLRSVFGIVDFVSAQSVTIMIAPDGNTELTIDGATYIVFNLELAQLTIVDAPYIMPLIDVAATQAANEIVFQSDANGLIYPASIDVVTANNGTLTVTYTSGQPLAVSDVNGNPVYVPSAAADYGDSINNRGVMDGDVITGVMPMTMSSTAGTVLTA